MGTFIDLTGNKYGRLTVLRRLPNKGNKTMWECRCDCGNVTAVPAGALNSGNTKSCGCLHLETVKTMHVTHNLRYTRLWRVWSHMKDRCNNPNNKDYNLYGGRGITYCTEWESLQQFAEWAMSSGYADDLTIDRIDPNGNYCPENCRWATRLEQSRNLRTVRWLSYNGETHTIGEWAEILGVKQGSLASRIQRGWTVEDALTRPYR